MNCIKAIQEVKMIHTKQSFLMHDIIQWLEGNIMSDEAAQQLMKDLNEDVRLRIQSMIAC